MPPMRRVGARVDREEQAGALDLFVELLARDARLHGHRQVLGVDRQHLVHAADVDADAALHRQQMAFERGADAERESPARRTGSPASRRRPRPACSRRTPRRPAAAPRRTTRRGRAARAPPSRSSSCAPKRAFSASISACGHVALVDFGNEVREGGGCVHACLQASAQFKPLRLLSSGALGDAGGRLPRGTLVSERRSYSARDARRPCSGPCPRSCAARSSAAALRRG